MKFESPQDIFYSFFHRLDIFISSTEQCTNEQLECVGSWRVAHCESLLKSGHQDSCIQCHCKGFKVGKHLSTSLLQPWKVCLSMKIRWLVVYRQKGKSNSSLPLLRRCCTLCMFVLFFLWLSRLSKYCGRNSFQQRKVSDNYY